MNIVKYKKKSSYFLIINIGMQYNFYVKEIPNTYYSIYNNIVKYKKILVLFYKYF